MECGGLPHSNLGVHPWLSLNFSTVNRGFTYNKGWVSGLAGITLHFTLHFKSAQGPSLVPQAAELLVPCLSGTLLGFNTLGLVGEPFGPQDSKDPYLRPR